METRFNIKTIATYTAIIVILTAVLTYSLIPKKIEIKEKIVTQIQERVRSHTVIKERPDGTKVTEIITDTNRDTKVVAERQSKPSNRTWFISAIAASDTLDYKNPTWGIAVQRSLVLGLYGGLYANNKGSVGLALSYSF